MSLESRQRQNKDTNCNQNYLNFIKKNQLNMYCIINLAMKKYFISQIETIKTIPTLTNSQKYNNTDQRISVIIASMNFIIHSPNFILTIIVI